MVRFKKERDFLKSGFGKEFQSDQNKGLKQPHYLKDFSNEGERVKLPTFNDEILTKKNIYENFLDRQTNRLYVEEKLDLKSLAYLLKMTQGVRAIRNDNKTLKRMVPSAGGRHPFETYLIVNRVEGLKKGVYRYMPMEDELLLVYEDNEIEDKLVKAADKQIFVSKASVTFIWAAIPYRTEWRFDKLAHKMILIDAGHICQNLYLACESLDLGTCAIGDYNQEKTDKLIKVDGEDEFAVYMAPVGIKEK